MLGLFIELYHFVNCGFFYVWIFFFGWIGGRRRWCSGGFINRQKILFVEKKKYGK